MPGGNTGIGGLAPTHRVTATANWVTTPEPRSVDRGGILRYNAFGDLADVSRLRRE